MDGHAAGIATGGMNMTKIKICGLSRPVDIDMVNAILPDYIGFVFAKSRRQVTMDTAKELKRGLRPEIAAVGVFVNESIDQIKHICEKGVIDIVQLHGDEGEEYLKALKKEITQPIIKAVRVRSSEDINQAEKLSCDYLLLDAYKEDQYGGCGEQFDWSMIRQIKKPFFVAGGIHAGNITKAIELVKPYGIDVSSGVETDGWKDHDKIKEIVTLARSVR